MNISARLARSFRECLSKNVGYLTNIEVRCTALQPAVPCTAGFLHWERRRPAGFASADARPAGRNFVPEGLGEFIPACNAGTAAVTIHRKEPPLSSAFLQYFVQFLNYRPA